MPPDQPVRARLVRTLAVLSVVATIPLWAPPQHTTSSTGVFMVAAKVPPGVAVVRLTAVVLVVAVAVLVVWRGARFAVLSVVPAALLGWVWWRWEGGGSYTVAMQGSLGQRAPHAYQSPWFAVAISLEALLALTIALAALGAAARRRDQTQASRLAA
ncbi:hypothetical protein [Cellulomonas sp. P5_C6]